VGIDMSISVGKLSKNDEHVINSRAT